MKRILQLFSLILIISAHCNLIYPQTPYVVKIMSWNVWYNPTGTYTFDYRSQYFRDVIEYADPDILIIVEVANTGDVNTFLTNVMNYYHPNKYNLGPFIANTSGGSGVATSNAIYYKAGEFDQVTNTVIPTVERDINRFRLLHVNSNNLFDIYAVHLKSSSGTSNEDIRRDELSQIFPVIDALNTDKYILLGDFNIYRSGEPGYVELITGSNPYFVDPENDIGQTTLDWSDSSWASIQSISTRYSWLGTGSSSIRGLQERFDYIFMPPKVYNSNLDSLGYNSDFTVFGQDGQHFKQSINVSPFPLGQAIADDLYYASDHLPAYATFTLTDPVPVELVSFTAQYVKKTVQLYWNTATEVMNYGFDIERAVNDGEWNKIGFVNGFGNSNVPHDYTFEDEDTDVPGHYKYRLKQIDTDGKFEYSPIAQTEVYGPDNYTLSENYPNPFNPTTSIDFQVPVDSRVTLKVLDVLGREVATLVDGQMPAGKHKVIFDGSALSSGIYIYQLRTDNKLLTRKMMLLK